MIFGLPWRVVLMYGAAALVVAGIFFFGHFEYEKGVSAERVRWQAAMHQAEAHARSLEQQRDAALAHIAQMTAQRRTQITVQSERGHDEIEAARPTSEAPVDPALAVAWRGAIDRLCIFPTAESGALPDSCRPANQG